MIDEEWMDDSREKSSFQDDRQSDEGIAAQDGKATDGDGKQRA